VYLEGALHRARHPLVLRQPSPPRPPAFDGPAPEPVRDGAPAAGEAVLNPFSVYLKGEALLRRQLAALSSWHLVNIIRAYGLSAHGADATRMPASELIDIIVQAARRRSAQTIAD
jgi:hypothetical protein